MPLRMSGIEFARWQELNELFQSAVELPAERQAAFIDELCSGNQRLCEQLSALLASDAEDWPFLDQPALRLAAPFMVDLPRLSTGDRIGDYTIIDLIGRGGMGEVYLAKDGPLNRSVALKLLPAEYTSDDNRLQRFRREARAASALNHPNILTIYQLGSSNDFQFIAAEYVEGETIRALMKRRGLPLAEVIEIAMQIAGALSAAHKAGIVHRDIKPENIMLRPDGYVKVLDFGLAKLAEQFDVPAEVGLVTNLNISSAVVMGTVQYMSPEQARGLSVDSRSDLFSLGVVLYEMLAGRAPFHSAHPGRVVNSILRESAPPLIGFAPELPGKLIALVDKALNKDRELRYQTAEEFLRDLRAAKEDAPLGKKLATDAHSLSVYEGVSTARVNGATVAHAVAATPTEDVWSERQTRKYSLASTKGKRITAAFAAMLVIAIALATLLAYRYFEKAKTLSATRPANNFFTVNVKYKGAISEARANAEPVVLDGVLYAVGGWKVCTPFANVDTYDSSANKWIPRAPMPVARGGHGVGVLNGLIYAVGGAADCGRDIASVEAYDPKTNSWTEKAPIPVARSELVVAVANGKLYAIGGTGVNGALNTEYDPTTDTWTDRAPMPTPRQLATAVVIDNTIYVMGGDGNHPEDPRAVEAYNPVTNAWIAKAPMPIRRRSFAAAVLDGIVYVFGGAGTRGEVDAYDPRTDSWSTGPSISDVRESSHAVALNESIYFVGGFDGVSFLSNAGALTPCRDAGIWSTRAPMPTARNSMAVAEINGVIYAAGGLVTVGGENRFLNVTEAYDPATNTWSTKKDMPTGRSLRGTVGAVVGGNLYVIGGAAGGVCTNANEMYDPLKDTWATKAPMPTPRCHLAVVAANDLIYAIGGSVNNSFSPVVEIYNPATNKWSTGPPMATARSDMAAAVVNDTIYVMGGGNLRAHLATVEAYDPRANKWTTKSPMLTPRTFLTAAAIDNRIVVAGGLNGDTVVPTVDVYDVSTDSWTAIPSPSIPRQELRSAVVDHTIYFIGGDDGGGQDQTYLSINQSFTPPVCWR